MHIPFSYPVPERSSNKNATKKMWIAVFILPKSETFVFDAEKLILDNNDEIWAKATVDKIVVATISSVRTSWDILKTTTITIIILLQLLLSYNKNKNNNYNYYGYYI